MLKVEKSVNKFTPNSSRVIVKTHLPGGIEHIERLINRILNLSESQIEKELEKVMLKFDARHKNFEEYLKFNYDKIKRFIPKNVQLSDIRKNFFGACFSCEYSIQSAAFFNPSIVPHPDQSNLAEGSLRVILSFRSVGEGHISSVEFRSGVLDKDCNLKLDEASRYAQMPYNVMHFSDSDYLLQFKKDDELSEKVLFPSSNNDKNGIEDARFVRFVDENGSYTYYATYTAYDGRNILPQIIETKDFVTFKFFKLFGDVAIDKGMALFPRKINGKFAMISRIDGENLYLMYSDDIRHWERAELIKEPENVWELGKIGNCGSPIETDKGWILLTHGVGPMREYSIGVALLDLENPAKVVGNMNEPLLVCNSEEREGYVPNVVYSCGALIHNDTLILPYAMSDTCSGVVKVSVAEMINNMQKKESSEFYANTT